LIKFFVSDLPNQNGRNIVITGGNRGIGYEAVKKFLAAGAHVIIG
jgi:NAD(P)-dependent dehydrogenase (short-subunit alcohol dehydrogenase family)